MIHRLPQPATGRRHGAFTLIELLIVVAIIAILAAIAVPNFLEAQTRSKVSRTYADMRSLIVALEAYSVDTNRYPFRHNTSGTGFREAPELGDRLERMSVLTTPIAYITTLPADVFEERLRPPNNVIDYWDRIQTAQMIDSFRPLDPPFPPEQAGWLLVSVGPDGILGPTSNDLYGWPDVDIRFWGSMRDAYDPTNGTISNGNIYVGQIAGVDGTPEWITRRNRGL